MALAFNFNYDLTKITTANLFTSHKRTIAENYVIVQVYNILCTRLYIVSFVFTLFPLSRWIYWLRILHFISNRTFSCCCMSYFKVESIERKKTKLDVNPIIIFLVTSCLQRSSLLFKQREIGCRVACWNLILWPFNLRIFPENDLIFIKNFCNGE